MKPSFELPFVQILKKRMQDPSPLMQFVVGPRQVGKTTGVEQFLRTQTGPTHYVLAEGELGPDSTWLRLQWQKAQSQKSLLVIDEIQKVDHWAETLKSLWDHDKKNRQKTKCIFLGSSSLSLKKGMTESLAGRYELLRVPHWGWTETQAIAPHLSLEDYLQYGGYPGAYPFLNDPQRFRSYIRDSIVKNVIEKDIFLHQTIRKPALFKQCVEILAHYPAQEISYTKLLGQLQEGGNVEIIKNYIHLLSESFLFAPLPKYSAKPVIEKTSSPKILPLCPALIFALSDTPPVLGRLLEMAVGIELLQIADHLSYWHHGNYEIDFVAAIRGRRFAIEVKSGRKKHSKSLGFFLKKYPKIKPIIIDQDEFQRLCRQKERFFDS